jgi:hypothetical protein
VPIVQATVQSLRGVQRWLYDQAVAAHQKVVMHWLLYLFGTTDCPSCGGQISVPESVEQAFGPTNG